MTDTITTNMEPARVNGRVQSNAIALFVDDSRGDLVDIEYLCQDCAREEGFSGDSWPVFDFWESGAYCRQCSAQID